MIFFLSQTHTLSTQHFYIHTLSTQAVAATVTPEELERAKNATISAVLMNMESRAVIAEDIGRQVLTYNERYVFFVVVEVGGGGWVWWWRMLVYT